MEIVLPPRSRSRGPFLLHPGDLLSQKELLHYFILKWNGSPYNLGPMTGFHLNTPGLIHIADTIQSAKGPDQKIFNTLGKWEIFEQWCGKLEVIPVHSVTEVLVLSGEMLDKS